jgi:hypothetical protein
MLRARMTLPRADITASSPDPISDPTVVAPHDNEARFYGGNGVQKSPVRGSRLPGCSAYHPRSCAL